ncbi:hypothetical protein [uncultured Methylobacterium sp.]|jgi:hypothetical protein|uniref:hypothetical protein n=1 Tax=uncultured Methylobacterium sp. TaxID=157278 RepID=UPI002636C860|nr:hypothetical protein [uncultured Methylobacterium sp.]
MNPAFAPKNPEARLYRLKEEIGEVMIEAGAVLHALGKAGRFGMDSRPPTGGQTNRSAALDALARLRIEMDDLQGAMIAVEGDLLDEMVP